MRATSSPARVPPDDGPRPQVRRRIGETMPALDQPQVSPGSEGADTAVSALAALEWRVSAVEARQADLRSFREDVTRELQATGSKVMFLNEQGVATPCSFRNIVLAPIALSSLVMSSRRDRRSA